MPANERLYGVQVGSEVYNLVISQEDFEKRKLDRERAKKLSQETNRRRKALEDRKRIAEEREARKIELELAKRRQRQIEATERYQRSHVGSPRVDRKHIMQDSRSRNTVDAILQQLRSGDGQMETENKPVDMERRKFEQEVEEQQRVLLERHRNQMMQEFTSQLHSRTTPHASAHTSPVSTAAVTNGNQSASTYAHQAYPYDPRLSQPSVPSNQYVDIMSGRMYSTNHTTQANPLPMHSTNHITQATPASVYSTNHVTQAPSHQTSLTKLTESLSRLFDKQNHSDSTPSNGMKIEEADDVFNDSLDGGKPQVLEKYSPRKDDESAQQKQENEDNNYEVYDDQDSLHGSSNGSSVASPRTMNNGDHTESMYTGSSLFRSYEKTAPTVPMATHGVEATHDYQITNGFKGTQVSSSHSDTSLPIYKGSSTTQNIDSGSYYVKSYRPWSATGSNAQPVTNTPQRPVSAYTNSTRIRPSSARIGGTRTMTNNINQSQTEQNEFISNQKEASNNYAQNSASKAANKLKVRFETQNSTTDSERSEKVFTDNGTQIKPNIKWGATIAKTSATPISDMFTTAWERENSTVTTATDTVIMHKQSPTVTKQSVQPKTVILNEQNLIVKKQEIAPPPETKVPLKGILRKVSKYANPFLRNQRPAYQSANVAKQLWVQNINQAKLNGVVVRDSLEQRHDPSANGDLDMTASKSVTWHEIRYNDGTSTKLGEPGSIIQPPVPVESSIQQVVAHKAPTHKKKSPAKPPKTPAPKSKPAPAKGGKKGGKGRKLKVAKEVTPEIEPRPPQPPKKKELLMSTVINYSIDGAQDKKEIQKEGSTPTRPNSRPSSTQNKIMFHKQSRVAWDDKDVTMDTLKSGGSSPSNRSGNIVVNQGNQVTIHMMSPEPMDSPQNIALNKTPTDQEITWLWEKVRTCLNSTRTSPKSRHIRKSSSDMGRENYYGRKPLYMTPPQTAANIVSIDGGMLSLPTHPGMRPHKNRRRIIRPNSASIVSNNMKKQASEAYSSYVQRGNLSYSQRKQKPTYANNNGQRQEGVRSATYPSPRPSGYAPSPPSSGRIHGKVSDSLAAFLLAETLAEQNMTEEEITRAMETLKKKTEEAQKMGNKVMPSALSMEEQKLVASLERLNSRLHDVQSTVSNNPHYKMNGTNQLSTWGEYNKPDYPSYLRRGRTISADSRYRTSRIRY